MFAEAPTVPMAANAKFWILGGVPPIAANGCQLGPEGPDFWCLLLPSWKPDFQLVRTTVRTGSHNFRAG